MPDIFLSYNREDQARAKLFAEAFERQGFKVWWDVGLRTGEAYDQVTEKALREAKAVVVLWSKRSVESRWVRAEATLADRNKTLVPCMIEPCERPIMFELTQTAELSHWQGDASDKAWTAFLSDVKRFVAKEEAPAAAAPATPLAAPTAPNIEAAAPPARMGERGERPSLAIMPFANRSGLSEDDVLAYGMVEDIVSAISLSPDIRVLASSSTLAWAGKATDLRVVGRDLGVRYLLEGNVRRVGPNLRVTVQLVEAETGAILWTQKFDRPLSELSALQKELVTEVAAHLGVQVQNIEMERALKKPGDITAYEAMQRVNSIYAQLSTDRLPIAVAEARRAVAIAPDYGAAHATLAITLSTLNFWTSDDDARKLEARHHLDRALALDPKDMQVLWRCAASLTYLGHPEEALLHAERAVDLYPNAHLGWRALGAALLGLARADEALACFDTEEKQSPRNFVLYATLGRRAMAHFHAGRSEQAIEAIDRAFRLNSDYPINLVVRAALCSIAGRSDDARDCIRRLRKLEPDTSIDFHAGRCAILMPPGSSAVLIGAFRRSWSETPTERIT